MNETVHPGNDSAGNKDDETEDSASGSSGLDEVDDEDLSQRNESSAAWNIDSGSIPTIVTSLLMTALVGQLA